MQIHEKLKILVVDDDFLVSKEIVRTLKSIGIGEVKTAPNGKKAIDILMDFNPDLVLMDIKMPVMGGIEATKIISDVYQIPVVILSAHDTQDLLDEAVENGASAYLTKPPEASEIEKAISIAMARHKDMIKMKELVVELQENKSILEQQKEELEGLIESRDKLMSIIAHDLRSPFQGIMMTTGLLDDPMMQFTEDEFKMHIKNLNEVSHSIYILLENLLDWSRVQSGKLEPIKSELNIPDVIKLVVSLLEINASNKKIQIAGSYEEKLFVYADWNMISTIVRNLLSNAIKFTPVEGSIFINTRLVDDMIVIEIKDTGVGMDEITLNKLFTDKTSSTYGTEGEKGTGFGLMLCKSLTELNGGQITVESIINEGTTFSLYFPNHIIEEEE